MGKAANASLPDIYGCLSSSSAKYLYSAWFSVYLLFLPVFLFVLYICFNKWKKPQSSASGGLSHSDVFTLHMVAMEMINIIGSCVGFYGIFRLIRNAMLATIHLFTLVTTGQMLFHSLTCVERYLAVVHPVTYLRLRREGGVTIRNIGIASVWAFSVSFPVIFVILDNKNTRGNEIFGLVLIVLVLPLVTYCSVSVLCVLIRPKPGAGGRKQIDQSKRATVYTMVAILGALLMRLIVLMIFFYLLSTNVYKVDACLVGVVSHWFHLPSSLVLPLLLLHRAGKLPNKAGK